MYESTSSIFEGDARMRGDFHFCCHFHHMKIKRAQFRKLNAGVCSAYADSVTDPLHDLKELL